MNTNTPPQQDESKELISGRQLLLHEIAHKLEEARAAKKQPITKPERKLKIPANHLRALENGNWDTLPDDVYVIGFLRQYSKYLGVDLSNEIERLKNTDYTLTKPLTFPDPPVSPSRLWAWIAGGAFVVLFITFNVISSDDEQQEATSSPANAVAHTADQNHAQSSDEKSVTPPAVKKEEKTIAKTAKPEKAPAAIADASKMTTAKPTTSKTAPTVKPAAITEAPKVKKAVEAAAKPAVKSAATPIKKTIVATAKPAVKAVATVSKNKLQSPLMDHPKPQTKAPANASRHVFRFEAVGAPIWMQVFLPNAAGDGKGRLLKEMLLQAGQSANIRYATESLWITCGNALALRIKVDKKLAAEPGSLGDGKKVLRDYRFDINKH